MVFFGTWIDKGMGMISGGFVPNPLHEVSEYIPLPRPELLIALGVWATGFLILDHPLQGGPVGQEGGGRLDKPCTGDGAARVFD